MHDTVKALNKENNDLKKKIAGLEQEEADFIADEETACKKILEAFEVEKKTMRDEIMRTKVELDKMMSTKLIM